MGRQCGQLIVFAFLSAIFSLSYTSHADARAALLLVTSTATAAMGAGTIQQALTKRFPGWKPAPQTPYCSEDAQHWSLAGDFDADGRADRLVKVRHGPRGHYAVLFNRPSGWTVTLLKSVAGRPVDPLLIKRRGEVFRHMREGNIVGPQRWLDRDVPMIGACESGGLNAWLWAGGRFVPRI